MCRPIHVVVTTRLTAVAHSALGVNKNKLVINKYDYVHVHPVKKSLQVWSLNPRSIQNKALSLSDYIVTHD